MFPKQNVFFTKWFLSRTISLQNDSYPYACRRLQGGSDRKRGPSVRLEHARGPSAAARKSLRAKRCGKDRLRAERYCYDQLWNEIIINKFLGNNLRWKKCVVGNVLWRKRIYLYKYMCVPNINMYCMMYLEKLRETMERRD